jgi:hypothetical protein
MNVALMLGRTRVRAAVVTASLLGIAACAGENLFTGTVTSGGDEPIVDITAPAEGSTLGAGSSVAITADVDAPNGLVTADYAGVFTADGATAFVPEMQSFSRPPFATLNVTLSAQPGGGVGEAAIVVRVTDGDGLSASDTVKITVN